MLINLRNALMTGKKWKNPYVTDGLVAMWDGEWNAGGGKHDPNATVWKNLAPQFPDFAWDALQESTSPSNVTFEDNCLYLKNGNRSEITISSIDDYISLPVSQERTIEIVAKWDWVFTDNSGNLQTPIVFSAGHNPTSRYLGHSVVGYVDNGSGSTVITAFGQDNIRASNPARLSITADAYIRNDCDLDVNSTKYRISKQWQGNESIPNKIALCRCARADVWVYNYRFYSRALTADEIAHNYAIDKARFNLP